MIADAADLAKVGVLDAETWASAHLGWAWAPAPPHDPAPELRLVRAVAERARAKPALPSAAAAAALARLLDPATPGLGEALTGLPPTPWPAATGWTPVRASRAVDVWGSGRGLLVQFDGPDPHVLLAILDDSAGRTVMGFDLLEPAGFEVDRTSEDLAMGPAVECPVAGALADLADAMRATDRTWPRTDNPDYLELRALAWARCRPYLPEGPPYEPMPEAERAALVSAFVNFADVPDDRVTRYLVSRFVDFGDGWLPDGPLSWSPGAVVAFFQEELERGAPLEDEEFEELPDLLAEFVRYALTQRGVPERWIAETVEAVEEEAEAAEDGFDPEEAGEIFSALLARGVDLNDEAAVERALRDMLAERRDPPRAGPF